MTTANPSMEPPLEQGLVIERVFDAPRELVWQAWTDPHHVMTARLGGNQSFDKLAASLAAE